MYKNEDTTVNYDFLYKYFKKQEIQPTPYRDRKEIIKQIWNIKKEKDEQSINVEELDLKYSNKKVMHSFNFYSFPVSEGVRLLVLLNSYTNFKTNWRSASFSV